MGFGKVFVYRENILLKSSGCTVAKRLADDSFACIFRGSLSTSKYSNAICHVARSRVHLGLGCGVCVLLNRRLADRVLWSRVAWLRSGISG